MKKIISRRILFSVCLLALAINAFAIWPPETVLEQESKSAAQNGPDRDIALQRQSLGVRERLENDRQRLEIALHDLNDDMRELFQSLNPGTMHENKSQEGNNGFSVR